MPIKKKDKDKVCGGGRKTRAACLRVWFVGGRTRRASHVHRTRMMCALYVGSVMML